ncbi:MAG: hypothetical protein ACI837_002053 [Crocinitomicaceae bacterium]|jgi:hypothetical protein
MKKLAIIGVLLFVNSFSAHSQIQSKDQIDVSAPSGFKIKWMDGSSSNESSSFTYNYELIAGDLVYIKNSSGQMVARWITKNTGTTVVKVEDLSGNATSVHVKDLRFK